MHKIKHFVLVIAVIALLCIGVLWHACEGEILLKYTGKQHLIYVMLFHGYITVCME